MSSANSCNNGTQGYKHSVVNFAFAKELFHRNWYVAALYLLAWLLFMGPVFNGGHFGSGPEFPDGGVTVLSLFGVFITFVYAVVAVCVNCDYLFKKPSADYFASTPLTRPCLLMSTYLAILVPALLVNLVVLAGCCYVDLQTATFAANSLEVFASVSLLALINTAFCLLCATLTGSRGMFVILSLMLNGYAFAMDSGVSWASGLFTFGVMSDAAGLSDAVLWLSPMAQVCESLCSSYTGLLSDQCWQVLGVYGVLALLALAAAAFLFCRRHVERSGDGVVFKKAHVVLGLAFGLAFGLGFALFQMVVVLGIAGYSAFSESEGVALTYLIVFLLVGALVSYAVLEAVAQRSMRVLRKRIPHFAVLTVACVALALGCCQYGRYQTYYVPDVSQVSLVECAGLVCTSDDPEVISAVIGLHQAILDEYRRDATLGSLNDGTYASYKEVVEDAEAELAADAEGELAGNTEVELAGNTMADGNASAASSGYYISRYVNMYVVYRMKDGTKVMRSYTYNLHKNQLENLDTMTGKLVNVATSEVVRNARVESLRDNVAGVASTAGAANVAYLEWTSGEQSMVATKNLGEAQFNRLLDEALAKDIMAGGCDPDWCTLEGYYVTDYDDSYDSYDGYKGDDDDSSYKDYVDGYGSYIYLHVSRPYVGLREYTLWPTSVELSAKKTPNAMKWIADNLDLNDSDGVVEAVE